MKLIFCEKLRANETSYTKAYTRTNLILYLNLNHSLLVYYTKVCDRSWGVSCVYVPPKLPPLEEKKEMKKREKKRGKTPTNYRNH